MYQTKTKLVFFFCQYIKEWSEIKLLTRDFISSAARRWVALADHFQSSQSVRKKGTIFFSVPLKYVQSFGEWYTSYLSLFVSWRTPSSAFYKDLRTQTLIPWNYYTYCAVGRSVARCDDGVITSSGKRGWNGTSWGFCSLFISIWCWLRFLSRWSIVVCLTMKSLQMWITMFRLHTASLRTGDKVD